MFLAWNYTLEAFFWIVLGAIILVSLTVFLARPQFRSKRSETSEETLSLTGESVDSPEGSILDQDATSDRVEEELEILEEIEKGETTWTRLRGWVRNIPTRLVRWIRNIPTQLRRLGRWIRNIPARLWRWIRNIPARLWRWVRNIPTRLVRWIRNILRFIREEWRAIVVGTGFCFYFVLVCILGALIIFETLIAYENIEITGEWGGITLETWIFRLALVFGAVIFLTGVISAYSFLSENQKWSRNSCRTAAIVLLLFIAFGLNVADIDWPTDSPGTPLDDEQWWSWERDLETAGIASFYLIFASLLFSGDLKRVWKWMAASLTDRPNEKLVILYICIVYSLCVCGLGALIVFDEIYFRATSNTSLVNSFRELILGITIIFIGLLSLYGFLMKNQKWLRIYSCRAAAALFLLLAIFGTGWDYILSFVIIPLLFSGDVKQIIFNEKTRSFIEKYR